MPSLDALCWSKFSRGIPDACWCDDVSAGKFHSDHDTRHLTVHQGAEATSTLQRGPQNPANRGKLQRSNTPNSRNRMALVFTPLPDEVNA